MALAICCVLVCPVQAAVATTGDESVEFQIKSACIVNFLKFIEFPSEAFKGNEKTIMVCLVGKDSTAEIIDRVLTGKSVGARRIVVTKYQDIAQLSAAEKMYHVVFFMPSAGQNSSEITSTLRKSAWLTIGETTDFCRNGGIMDFRIDNDKVRFDVNVQAAKQAKLKISSHLLKLANVIGQNSDKK